MKFTVRSIGLVCLVVTAVAGTLHAQLLVPTQLEDLPFVLKEHRISVQIDNQLAEVTITQVYYNPNQRVLEGKYLFSLPQDTTLSGLTLCSQGMCTEGKLLDAEQARQTYENIVRNTLDPALLQSVGGRAVELRVFPIPAQGEKTVKLRYQQVVEQRGNVAQIVLPAGNRAERVTLRADIRDKDPIAGAFSPGGALSLTRQSDTAVQLSLEVQGSELERGLTLYYTLAHAGMGFEALAQRTPGEDGYFSVLINPVANDKTAVLPKDIVFVFDVSGSMEGEKVEQAKAALRYALERLNPEDRFALVTFSDLVHTFAPKLTDAREVDRAALERFVSAIEAGGSTDLDAALKRGFRYFTGDNRLKLLVFLTDGEATSGVTDAPQIVEHVLQANVSGARLFVFGVGYDVNARLLDRLSAENGGVTDYITPGQSLERAVATFYEAVGTPLLSDLKIDFGGAEVYDTYPRTLPDLFKASQLQLFGRFKRPGSHTITLQGRRGDQTLTYTLEVNFPEEDQTHRFLSKIWAKRKVASLLAQIRRYGEDEEWVKTVKALALRYGIVTPYTSFLADPDTEDEEHVGMAAPPQAAFNTSGKAAVNYSQSLQEMADSTSVSRQQVTRLVNGRLYIKGENDVWSPYGLETYPDTSVRFGSPAYFWLVDRLQLKALFALGTELVVVVDEKPLRIAQDSGITEVAELANWVGAPRPQQAPPSQTATPDQSTTTKNRSQLPWVWFALALLGLVGVVVMTRR